MAVLLKDASTRRLLISKSFKFFAPFELKQEFEKYREELLKKSKLNEFTFHFTTEFLLKKFDIIITSNHLENYLWNEILYKFER